MSGIAGAEGSKKFVKSLFSIFQKRIRDGTSFPSASVKALHQRWYRVIPAACTRKQNHSQLEVRVEKLKVFFDHHHLSGLLLDIICICFTSSIAVSEQDHNYVCELRV